MRKMKAVKSPVNSFDEHWCFRSHEDARGQILARLETAASTRFRYYPKELRLAANGIVLRTQKIVRRRTRLAARLDFNEPLAFVEVFSEENVRLLIVIREQWQSRENTCFRQNVWLSQRRLLQIWLQPQPLPHPVINVCYCDPAF
jgi:hypothetical protein